MLNAIRVAKTSEGVKSPIVTMEDGRVRFNDTAIHQYNIAEYSHMELFVNVSDKLLGVKLINNGDDKVHFKLRKFMAPNSRTPLCSFSANRLIRLLGQKPTTLNWFGILPSDNKDVDFWIDMSKPLMSETPQDIKPPTVNQSDIQTDSLVQSRFQRYTPHVPLSRVSKDKEVPKVLNAPIARVDKNLITFNHAASTRFDLYSKKGVEVFINPDTKQLGLKFYETKEKQCYTLTKHPKNGTKMFSWAGIFTKLGLRRNTHGFKFGGSTYLKIMPSDDTSIDCIIDMTEVMEKFGADEVPSGMKPIRSYIRRVK